MIGFDKERKTYYVSYKYKDPLTDKWHTSKKRGFKLKREAAEYEANLKISFSQKKSTSMTFREMAKLWETNIQSSPESIRQHNEHFNIRFSSLIDKPIDKLTKPVLLQWRNELAEADCSTRTKNLTLLFVRAVFKFASEVYNIPNVGIVLKNFKKTDDEIMNSEMQVWSPEEFSQFSSSVDNKLYNLFFKTLFWTGARRGEIIALQTKDLKDGSIYIKASQRDSTKGLKPTKTKQIRKVALDDNLYGELMKLKQFEKSGYLFGGETPLAPTTISRYFNSGIKKSGVKKIRLHDLRHSHATWLINNGVNIVAVSKRLGHTSIEQTLKTYTHLLEDTDKKMMEIINEKTRNL